MSVVIQVDHLAKQYRLGAIGGKRLVDDLSRWWANLRGKDDPLSKIGSAVSHPPSKRARDLIWALKDVSFEVKQGEVLGIIGRNGAGKSTLLKILSRVTAPTVGEVRVKGRIASLLEVGTGFHPELTGRENIFLNGAILGMTKAEIRSKFAEIVAFAEIDKFVDTPVKRYSSGMYVRLAFAVAAHLEPEILIVDEVLAVGDIEFQKKCLGKMKDVAGQGRTVLFVSHNMAAVTGLCSKGILLQGGQLALAGDSATVVDAYLRATNGTTAAQTDLRLTSQRTGTGKVVLTSFHVESADGTICSTVLSGADVTIVLGYECKVELNNSAVDVGFSIATESGILLTVFYASYTGQLLRRLPPVGTLRCKIEKFPLAAGLYNIGARVTVGGVEADWPKNGVGEITVEAGDFYGTGNRGFAGRTTFLLQGNWSFKNTNGIQTR